LGTAIEREKKSYIDTSTCPITKVHSKYVGMPMMKNTRKISMNDLRRKRGKYS
jgi:hypothetical protein